MDTISQDDLDLEERALQFVKKHRSDVIKKFADPDVYRNVTSPVSLFMAGSPGAGKTEVSKSLIKRFNDAPVRIDADEIRACCPEYKGINAHLFQKAANKGVNILYDYVLDKNINCILDGTFAYAGAVNNIGRSLKHGRIVQVWFVYQDPIKAWEVTKAREIKETRHVSKEIFIDTFLHAKNNARAVKSEFGNQIELNLLVKNYDDGHEELKLNINSDELDQYIADDYSRDKLIEKLI